MLKKRLVGVITVKDGWAVQSFGYARHLPLGHPECLAENLDRWGVDEILVMSIDRSRRGAGPDLGLVRRLGALGLATPVTYGGGIRSAADAGAVIEAGAERVTVDRLLGHAEEVRAIARLVGAQAVVGVLPLANRAGRLTRRDYIAKTDTELKDADLALFSEGVISEALVVDWVHEGTPGGFDASLVSAFPASVPLIAFGGLTDPARIGSLLARGNVVACAVGNMFAYREHAVQHLRRALEGHPVRGAAFQAFS